MLGPSPQARSFPVYRLSTLRHPSKAGPAAYRLGQGDEGSSGLPPHPLGLFPKRLPWPRSLLDQCQPPIWQNAHTSPPCPGVPIPRLNPRGMKMAQGILSNRAAGLNEP